MPTSFADFDGTTYAFSQNLMSVAYLKAPFLLGIGVRNMGSMGANSTHNFWLPCDGVLIVFSITTFCLSIKRISWAWLIVTTYVCTKNATQVTANFLHPASPDSVTYNGLLSDTPRSELSKHLTEWICCIKRSD